MVTLFEGFVADPDGVEATKAKVAKAAKKCARIGMPVPSLVVTVVTGEEKVSFDSLLPSVTIPTRLIRIEAEGDLRIGGWKFIAVNEPVTETEALVVRVPGYEGEIPEEFRAADPDRCDQCNKKRVRNQSFIIVSEQGEYRQVGRNCLADFLGHDPKALVEMLSIWADLQTNDDGIAYGSGAGFWTFSDVLSTAAMVVTAFGWVGRAKAEEQGSEATADIVRLLLSGMRKTMTDDEKAALAAIPTQTVEALVADTLTAIANINRNTANEWEYDISVLAKADRVPAKRVGLAASSIILGIRLQERRAAAAAAGESHFVGKPGEKVEMPVKVTFIRTINGNYGPTVIVKMRSDGEGADFVWFASNEPNVEVGAEVTLKGTVKAHQQDKYTGKPVTVVTRCALAV